MLQNPKETPMQFGIKTPPQHCSWDDMLSVWRTADDIDIFESAWNFDHFYPLVGDPSGPCMEAWVTLSALAQATKRIRIGCMVNGTPYRHPALVANMAASLDIVSGGRFDLGIGAGWHEEECEAYGFDLMPLRDRMNRFEEAVQVIRLLLTNEFSNFRGNHFKISNARCEPKGPQGCPPIVIGGGGEKRTLKIAARYADHWNLAFAPPEVFRAKREILARHCEDVGRDFKEITCSVQLVLPADQDPMESAAQAAALKDHGADLVIYSLRTPYRSEILEPLARALEAV
jgi:F420-dependent oxidoreductase-like protein